MWAYGADRLNSSMGSLLQGVEAIGSGKNEKALYSKNYTGSAVKGRSSIYKGSTAVASTKRDLAEATRLQQLRISGFEARGGAERSAQKSKAAAEDASR
jgi:hypothetical protein